MEFNIRGQNAANLSDDALTHIFWNYDLHSAITISEYQELSAKSLKGQPSTECYPLALIRRC